MSHDDKKKFYCREWAFQKLSHCLDQRPASKTCGALLLGGPGCGKTTLCAELCFPSGGPGARQQRALNRRLLAHHFLQGHNEKSLSLSEFVRALVTQILNHSGESHRERALRAPAPPPAGAPNPRTLLADAYLDKLKGDPEIQIALRAKNIELSPDDCLKRALLFPLLEIDPPKASLFILVDSIDEHSFVYANSTLTRCRPRERSSQSKTIAELLANHHHLFPQWLLLVCTARKQSKSIAKMFTGFRKLSLDDLRKGQVVRDVQQYILARLDQENSLRQHISRDTAEMLNQLHIKSNGCFLYLEKVLDGVSDAFIVLREVREIPGTLNGLYLWLCQRLFNRRQFGKVQPLLNVLLAAKCALNETILFDIVQVYSARITLDDFTKRFVLLKRILVVGKSGNLRLFHHSFAEWLLDIKHCTQKYLCNIFHGHCVLAMYYTLHAKFLNSREIYDYSFHLTRMEQFLNEQQKPKKLGTGERDGKEIYRELKALKELAKFDESCTVLETSFVETEVSAGEGGGVEVDKNAIYAEVNKVRRTAAGEELDLHTLVVLWLVLSGGNVEECLLEGNEMAGVNFGAFLPTDPKVMRLLLEAGAVEQADAEGCEYESQMSLASTSSEQSPEPLFDLHDLHGQAALHVAARLGQAQVVKVLLEAGANAATADADGWTPLRAAAWGGHTDVVQLLVAHRVPLDATDAESRTALRAAAWSGHEEIVNVLLAHGASVNLTDHEGRTALIAAAYMGHADIVDHLLDYGADVNHADADGRTALSVATLCAPRAPGANVVAILLERGALVDFRDKEGMTPLLVAAFEGHKEVCELLLENEADVDHCDNSGRSPLWAAASMGHGPVVALLLFWGCCIDSMDSEGRTVLSVAAAQGCVEVVRQLLDRGLDEQHRDNSGWTPLHYAAFEGHLEVCEALLESGAKLDETDNEGKAALALASQGGHAGLIHLFIGKYNAPTDQRPHDGKTALRLAALEGHYEIVEALVRAGGDLDSKDADGRSSLYVLALDNRLAMAKFFVRSGADVETRDLEGRTPLHVSSWQGHTEMVELLLNFGKCEVDACDAENRTALHSASWQGHDAIVRLLLAGGARADHACNQGATALGIAAQEGHAPCVVALLAHGADPSHSDACGRSALRVAAKGGHRGVVALLEAHAASRAAAPPPPPASSSGANSVASTAEVRPVCAEWSMDHHQQQQQQQHHQRRSTISLGHSSNSKSSSNLTGSSHSSRNEERGGGGGWGIGGGGGGGGGVGGGRGVGGELSFTQQLQQCSRGGKTRPLSKLLSPLQSEPQSPIYASPPLSPVHDLSSCVFGAMNIYQPVLRHNNFAKAPDTHFARDTHMRIILGNSSASNGFKGDKKVDNSDSKQSGQKPKRNGIVTNPALRLVANVKNGLDTAAANLRKSTSSANPSTKTNSFHWRKETPL